MTRKPQNASKECKFLKIRMKIMQVNGINTNYNSRPAFQARIPQELQNNILRQAVEFGTEGLNNAKKQIANVQRWGRPTTILETAFDLSSKTSKLGISNFSTSKLYGAGLEKQKNNLYDTFMSLKEQDILKAEKQIAWEVENSKMDLINRACRDKKLMKKITGETNPTDEKLASAIDKLDEEQIVTLRFGLDEPTKFEQGPTLDFEF